MSNKRHNLSTISRNLGISYFLDLYICTCATGADRIPAQLQLSVCHCIREMIVYKPAKAATLSSWLHSLAHGLDFLLCHLDSQQCF